MKIIIWNAYLFYSYFIRLLQNLHKLFSLLTNFPRSCQAGEFFQT